MIAGKVRIARNKPYGENVTSSKHAASLQQACSKHAKSMQQASCRQAASSNSLLAIAYFKEAMLLAQRIVKELTPANN